MSVCGACPNHLDGEETIACSVCKQSYHLDCVSLPGRRTKSARERWMCAVCVSNTRMHGGNFNSPGCKGKSGKSSSATETPPYGTPVGSPEKKEQSISGTQATAVVTNDSSISMDNVPQLYYDLIKAEIGKAALEQRETAQGLRSEMERLTKVVTDYKVTCDALQRQTSELTESLNFLYKEHDASKKMIGELQLRTKHLEDDKGTLKQIIDTQAVTIGNMQSRIEDGEQRARAKNLEIFGIPERKSELLPEVIIQIAKTAGITVRHEDMEFVTRVAPRPGSPAAAAGRPKPIVVKFHNKTQKEDVLRAVRKRRGVNSQDVGISGDKAQIYVNDHLTPMKKMLFSRARAACKELGFQHCWTAYTKIYARMSDQSHPILIRSETDIAGLSKVAKQQ